ncbi:MAG: LysR family transcriptional regulator [Clostridiales bacterium]|nr:LysR family transcriptional regulator [Clostridiales bacterium]
MKTSDWVILQTLYQCRNITRAAEQLYITQPTLTKRLKLIEEEFGVTIAIRGKHGVDFTPEGDYLAIKAGQILTIMDEIHQHLSESKQAPVTTLHIGASNSFARFMLPDLLLYYQQSHPHIHFDITTSLSSPLCRQVERGELDFAIAFGDVPFNGRRFHFESQQVYLASTTPLDMSRLSTYPYITYPLDRYGRQILENWWFEHYVTPFPSGLTVKHADICREMVLKGLGYSFFFVRDYMKNYPEYVYPLYYKDQTPLTRNTWIFCPASGSSPEAESFISYALEYAGKMQK